MAVTVIQLICIISRMEELSLSFLGPQVGATPGHPAGPPALRMTVNIDKLSKELAKRWTNVTSQVGGGWWNPLVALLGEKSG